MGRVLVLTFALLFQATAATHGALSGTDARVHEPGICWEPDVEFPVPCDDDDD